MTATSALLATRFAGLTVTVEGGSLRVLPSPSPTLADALRRHKAEIVSLLERLDEDPAESCCDWPAWTEREDVQTAVEDLADEGQRPGRIARTLGLTRAEVITILRRTGR
jgi:hypothetical protein